ncbi:MAG: AcrB/AcrD/AcrF family protein [Acidobacteriota bacterium]|nr:AcrB/AcrD/AcrF family protein [Acidobacteriota bacterium]
MFEPQSYAVALTLMVVSMLCWGSWANSMKMCPGYRFQLFYWDYVLGLLAGAALWGVTLGSWGGAGRSFAADLAHAGGTHVGLAMLGGAVFNVANLLLVAAIDIAGLAVAFPVGIGLALVVGAVSSYVLAPAGNPALLFGGIALVVAAIVLDALAYRLRESVLATGQRSVSVRGVVLSLVAGLLMGTFYPFVARSMSGVDAPGPYAIAMFFALGVLLCALPANLLLMRKPLDGGPPAPIAGWLAAPLRWHLWGALGGGIWCTGAVMNFVASRAHVVGPAVSYSIGQGATMISAGWGVLVWREFTAAPARARVLLGWMFVLFLCGLSAVALAPVL